MTPAISFSDFSLRYSLSAPWALSQLTLGIPTGACCAVLGAVSSGKSTLLQTISGLLGKHHASAETQGEFVLAGREGTAIPRDVLFPEVGLVLQDPYVMVSGIHDTVEAEVGFTLQNLGLQPSEIQSRVAETLNTFGLQELAQRHPRNLSGGELQRVALASVLVVQPRVLLLDEPRNALDSAGQDTLARILQGLCGKTTVIFSDYDLDLAMAVADFIIVLDRGKCLYYGPKAGFIKQSEQFESILISDSWQNVLPKIAEGDNQRVRKFIGVDDASA